MPRSVIVGFFARRSPYLYEWSILSRDLNLVRHRGRSLGVSNGWGSSPVVNPWGLGILLDARMHNQLEVVKRDFASVVGECSGRLFAPKTLSNFSSMPASRENVVPGRRSCLRVG